MTNRIFTIEQEYIEFVELAGRVWAWRVCDTDSKTVCTSSESFPTKQAAFDNLKLTLRIATDAIAMLPTVPGR